MEACVVTPLASIPSDGTTGLTAKPRLLAASLFALLLCGSEADAASKPPPALLAVATENYGNLPSGEFPILFNDRTVYARPDILKRSRVLAALVKDGHMYVPLRSMFEQMGATVSVSADGKTITAVKNDASVSVTLGKDEAIINGEARPLDVPPMLYKDVVLVPVRVISEALGAYVQWESERRLVVVRYIPVVPVVQPTAVPTVAPPIPTSVPTLAPVIPPVQRSYRSFIQAAIAAPQNYNEFSAGQFCTQSFLVSGVYAVKNSPFAVKVDYRHDAYVTSDNFTDTLGNHYTRFATIDGGTAFTPVFLARQSTLDGRLEYQVAAPRIAIGVGFLHADNSYGYPQFNAVGVGIEKLPDLRPGINPFGSAFYYPTASGNYTVTNPASLNVGKTYQQQYQILKFDLGLALVWARSPVYIHAGFSGDQYTAKQNAPVNQTHDGPYVGLGLKL